MPTLIADRRMPYGKNVVQKDEKFEASDKDAKVLIATRRARLADQPKAVDLPETVMQRASKREPLAEEAAPLPESGTYQTRHLEAGEPTGRRRGRPRKSQSSHQDQASEDSTSEDSEDASE